MTDPEPSPLDENPTCEPTHTPFRFTGDGLVAAEITTALGIEPDFARDRGAPVPASRAPAARQRPI